MNKPILSICIPTYNRAKFLDKLLLQIFEFDDLLKSRLQICISDNASTDNTQEVILKWKNKIEISSTKQVCNIGGSRNFQAVAKLARCPWTILMGDDDRFLISGLENLLIILNKEKPDTWILGDIQNQDLSSLLRDHRPGKYSRHQLKKKMLIKSLDAFGFMSMYVVPSHSLRKFIELDVTQIYGWPHITLFFMELPKIEICIVRESIVLRGSDHGEITQTWHPHAWLNMMMQKTKLCSSHMENGINFNSLLALREYVRWTFVRQLFAAKLVLGDNKKICSDAIGYINETQIYKVIKYFLIGFVFLALQVPSWVIRLARNIVGKKDSLNLGGEKNSPSTDAMKRGW